MDVSVGADSCDWVDPSPLPPLDLAPVPSRQEARLSSPPRLAELTTLRVGGPVADYVEAHAEDELIDAVRDADRAARPLLVLGGGSNVIAGDGPFPGVVVRDARSDIRLVEDSACGGATVCATAGTPWDAFVVDAVQNGWAGVEALSGIPGTVGAAPVQNIGAYGQEVAETLASVTVWDRARGRRRMLALADLALGYRTSVLKRTLADEDAGGGRAWGPTPRYVVLSVQFQMGHASLSNPVRYAQLARTLGVEVGARAPALRVREAVLALRRSKGMVLDPADHDTWSAGSFFTNPVLDAEEARRLLPAEAPRFPVEDRARVRSLHAPAPVVPGVVKTSAAWLIDHAGFGKGYGLRPGARATLSTKHALAITNRGEARAADVVELARAVRAGVRDRFGIVLAAEPVAVGARV